MQNHSEMKAQSYYAAHTMQTEKVQEQLKGTGRTAHVLPVNPILSHFHNEILIYELNAKMAINLRLTNK